MAPAAPQAARGDDVSNAAGHMKLFLSLLLILPAPLNYAQIFQNQARIRIKKAAS